MGYNTIFTYILKGNFSNFDMNEAMNNFFYERDGEEFDPFVDSCKWL